MIDELRRAAQYVLGLDIGGRLISIYPDDTFIVSYPRSGNTWMRFLIANLVYGDAVTFANIEKLIPDIYAHSRRYLKRIPRPRILKSHEYLDLRYNKTIYIIRDPRDVVVSSYYFHLKQKHFDESLTIDEYVTQFVRGLVWGAYGSWGQNVGSWLSTKRQGVYISPLGDCRSGLFGSWAENVSGWLASGLGNRDFLLLRYEDMVTSPAVQLARVAKFLNIRCCTETIARAVERSSAGRMRKLEREGSLVWTLTRSTRQDVPFVREAKVGSWRTELSASSVAEIESNWRPLMKALGYEPLTRDDRSEGLPEWGWTQSLETEGTDATYRTAGMTTAGDGE